MTNELYPSSVYIDNIEYSKELTMRNDEYKLPEPGIFGGKFDGLPLRIILITSGNVRCNSLRLEDRERGAPSSQTSLGTSTITGEDVSQWMPFRDMIRDVKRRLPYYWSDYKDAFFSYRSIATVISLYFINLMPALAYTLDMYRKTEGNWGVTETLLGSALGSIVFPLFAAQPLCIVGVTGLLDLYGDTIYKIIDSPRVDFLQFMGWVGVWSAISHWLVAIFNLVNYCRYITDFTSQVFGFYVGVIYIQKGIEFMVHSFGSGIAAGWLSIVIALVFWASAWGLVKLGNSSYVPLRLGEALVDFSLVISVLFWSGITYVPGHLEDTPLQRLPVGNAFLPSINRSWIVPWWELDVGHVFAALPLGLIVTALFYLDHNVSSLDAQGKQFPLKKPPGFHWDFFLLGCTTLFSAFFGIPYPNGLVPQAPMHTDSLCVRKIVRIDSDTEEGEEEGKSYKMILDEAPRYERRVVSVVETRLPALIQGVLLLITMTGPILSVLSKIPDGVLAGVFLHVGWLSLENNGITLALYHLARDSRLTPKEEPLTGVSKKRIAMFVGIKLIGALIPIAISQTVAAIAFPIVVLALVPIRATVINKIFTQEELRILDKEVASGFVVGVMGGIPKSWKKSRAAFVVFIHATRFHLLSERVIHKAHNSESTDINHKHYIEYIEMTAITVPQTKKRARKELAEEIETYSLLHVLTERAAASRREREERQAFDAELLALRRAGIEEMRALRTEIEETRALRTEIEKRARRAD
ncbi:hypothetical protein PROFUN_11707 [Planoprotostelium fungivorum]|uniref:Bicarbonate transporter-like transmembrane domain-containing protein n=1 Tax=Planoprotostelium fungivorum TaxID=1890364 RepID=A0A2P6N964_9EUKA|nr:hypothetical protein PROFUN_11707 [Planoprotostelium fungivorum]